MKKFYLLLLSLALFAGAAQATPETSDEQTTTPAQPTGAIHHFDFSGDLRDRVTGQPLYISKTMKFGRPDAIGRYRLVPDSVQFIDTDEGERTAIRIRPMEFAAKLNWVDCPKLTLSMLLRFDEKDFQDGNRNWISWLETIKFDAAGKRVERPEELRDLRMRKLDGEYHSDGKIDASPNDDGLEIPKDEWVRLTIVIDEAAQSRTIYMNDRVTYETCDMPIDSMDHANRVGLFHEMMPDAIKGYVSDVKIYDRALTAEEVAQLHGVAEFDEYDLFEAFRPLFTLVFVLTVIPVALWLRKPWRLSHTAPQAGSRSSNNAMALDEIDQAIGIWFRSVGNDEAPVHYANSDLTFRYPRAMKLISIRKHLKRAIELQPSDPEIVERINRVIDAHNAAISYHFNGSILYILVFLFSLFFQEAFQGTRTIFTSDDLTFTGAVADTFAKYWQLMLLMIPYIAVSMGWRLIGQYGETIEDTDPAQRMRRSFKQRAVDTISSGAGFLKISLSLLGIFLAWCWSTIMWGIRNSGEVIKHIRNGVVVSTSSGVNPAMFFGGFLVVAIVIAIIYFIITYATIVVMISPLAVIPYKLLRNYILHR